MSLFIATSAALSLLQFVDALTDAEITKFATRGCGVRFGSCSGGFMYGEVSVTKDTDADTITLVANSIPDHPTCNDTLSAGETCYNDPLTSWFEEQQINEVIPLNPVAAASTTSLSTGASGYAINGVQIFSPYSLMCTDAVTDEAVGFDDCLGHPQEQGNYHYHASPICLDGYAEANASQSQFFVGVALDGFPIYLEFDDDGVLVSNALLDDCHGYDPLDGGGYRYIVNDEFPYIIGCFTGTPLSNITEHCGRRRLISDEEIEMIDAKIERVRSASHYRYDQTARRRLGWRGHQGVSSAGSNQIQGVASSSTQEADGCGDACVGDECGEIASVAMCEADTSSPTAMPTAIPTAQPTARPTEADVILSPTTENPTTAKPTTMPSAAPSPAPTPEPSAAPSEMPTVDDVSSVTVSCSGDCECPDGVYDCTLSAAGKDAAKDATLSCGSSSWCAINCLGDNACAGNSQLKAEDTVDEFTVLCDGKDACKGNTLIDCGSVVSCTLHCEDETSCEDATIDATQAGSFECSGYCLDKVQLTSAKSISNVGGTISAKAIRSNPIVPTSFFTTDEPNDADQIEVNEDQTKSGASALKVVQSVLQASDSVAVAQSLSSSADSLLSSSDFTSDLSDSSLSSSDLIFAVSSDSSESKQTSAHPSTAPTATVAQSATVSCSGDCECPDGVMACTLNAAGTDAAKDAKLSCGSSSVCAVSCVGDNACSGDAEIRADDVTALLSVICDGADACKSNTLIDCGSVALCSLHCADATSCEGTTVDATKAGDFQCLGHCDAITQTDSGSSALSVMQSVLIASESDESADDSLLSSSDSSDSSQPKPTTTTTTTTATPTTTAMPTSSNPSSAPSAAPSATPTAAVVISATVSCSGDCECPDGVTDCTLNVAGEDAAKDATLSCKSSSVCAVNCLGDGACSGDAEIRADDATDVMAVLCDGKDACKGNTLIDCGSVATCSLQCADVTSCEDTTVDATKTGSFECTGHCDAIGHIKKAASNAGANGALLDMVSAKAVAAVPGDDGAVHLKFSVSQSTLAGLKVLCVFILLSNLVLCVGYRWRTTHFHKAQIADVDDVTDDEECYEEEEADKSDV